MRIVQDMYDDSSTAVRCEVGVMEGFEVKVTASRIGFVSCLFAMVMDRMTDFKIREEAIELEICFGEKTDESQ